jgi:DNA ligase-1
MEKVIKIFKQIQNTSSTNDKKAIIEANKDNELFKKCLIFLLDSNIVTGISDKKLNKFVGMSGHELNSFEEVMKYLADFNSGSDMDIGTVQGFIENQPEEYQEFYKQMVTKKFRLGCDKKVVNKVIPGLIPTFDVMLGTSIEKCKIKPNEPISISRKLNGTRTAFVGNKCMTRQGKEYTGLEHIISDLKNMGYENMFVDGELLYKNKEGLSDSEAFQKGTGIAMSKSDDKSQLKLVVFDIFPLEEFWSGKSKPSYLNRKHTYLKQFAENLKNNPTENLELVPIVYEGTDHTQIWKWLDYAEEHDWEGCMVNLDTPYECKRTKNLIKVKKFFDISLRVVGVEEGTGRNKGRLGAIVCKYYDNTVNVSGFTDEQRVYYWLHKDKILNHIVDVKYKEVTTDKKTGLKSLQFPIYLGVRFDKSIPDDEEKENK